MVPKSLCNIYLVEYKLQNFWKGFVGNCVCGLSDMNMAGSFFLILLQISAFPEDQKIFYDLPFYYLFIGSIGRC